MAWAGHLQLGSSWLMPSSSNIQGSSTLPPHIWAQLPTPPPHNLILSSSKGNVGSAFMYRRYTTSFWVLRTWTGHKFQAEVNLETWLVNQSRAADLIRSIKEKRTQLLSVCWLCLVRSHVNLSWLLRSPQECPQRATSHAEPQHGTGDCKQLNLFIAFESLGRFPFNDP